MTKNNFITSSLSLTSEQIETMNIVHNDDTSKTVYIKLKAAKKNPECPRCGGPTVIHAYNKRTMKHCTIEDDSYTIVWSARRYICKDCEKTFSETNPFTINKYRLTISQMRKIMLDLKHVNFTFKDIAERNGISITTVIRYFDSFVTVPRQKLPVSISMDEIHSDMAASGSSYLFVMCDNVSRELVEVLSSRKKNDLKKYFEKIPQTERDKVLYVTMDCWDTYREISKRYFRNAVCAADPFHVVKHINDACDAVRIRIMNQAIHGSEAYYLLKKWSFLLKKDVDDEYLDNRPVYNNVFKRKLNRRDILEMILSISDELELAYKLKESYRDINKTATEETAEYEINSFMKDVVSSNIPEFQDFITLENNWHEEIVNSFKRPVEQDYRRLSNALAENINGRIRELSKVSYGYGSFSRFRRRCLYALNTHIFYAITANLLDYSKKESNKQSI